MDISSIDYSKFREILERQSGILLGDNKQYLVVSRLANFIKEHNVASLTELIDKIAIPSGASLLQKVIDRMTTNETLWFRDQYPFDFMKNAIIPALKKKGRSRIWCAACSSGQEPYSLSMLLHETMAQNSIEVLASDLSLKVLDKAKQGIYQDIELKRGMPKDRLNKFFTHIDDDNWQVNSAIRANVRYQPINLLKIPYTQGKFDVIFCRNVLIYFSQENKTKVLNALYNSLQPGGYLFLGASESLTRDCNPLEMVRCNPGLVYQKSE
ncbi:MAG: protein-glutamate O-methyltransferase CheR [Kangiellaceae bacterium]|nr:protein-glutamate O-methyltransferase CheR [Kangiellaceae bacterium]